MTFPNFIIAGAAKSGTTSLFYYLSQHPQIEMLKKKETNFFSLEGRPLNFEGPGDDKDTNLFSVTSIEDYKTLFDALDSHRLLGEASPSYLYYKEAPLRIKRYIPRAKIIVILRNPIDRAYSNYMHLLRAGREKLSFREAIEKTDFRLKNNWQWFWDYVGIGHYHRQLINYMNCFDSSQLKVVLYDDLKNEPEALLREIFDFLEVDNCYIPNTMVRYNAGGAYVNKTLQRVIKRVVVKDNLLKKALRNFLPHDQRLRIATRIVNLNRKENKMSTIERDTLKTIYKSEIEQLQSLINKDLSHWLC